ncbi:hypothetical protein V8E36_004050 [Tilletia maclaganii]
MSILGLVSMFVVTSVLREAMSIKVGPMGTAADEFKFSRLQQRNWWTLHSRFVRGLGHWVVGKRGGREVNLWVTLRPTGDEGRAAGPSRLMIDQQECRFPSAGAREVQNDRCAGVQATMWMNV